MNIIMVLYYVITAGLVLLLGWNFLREKRSPNNLILGLLVLIPLVLRLLRVK
jgi:Flp pilus assembly protein protease CpaA